MCNGTAQHFCECIPISVLSSHSPRILSSPRNKTRCLDLPDSRRSRPRCLRPLVALHSLLHLLHTDSDLPLHHWLLQLHRTVPVGGLPSLPTVFRWEGGRGRRFEELFLPFDLLWAVTAVANNNSSNQPWNIIMSIPSQICQPMNV